MSLVRMKRPQGGSHVAVSQISSAYADTRRRASILPRSANHLVRLRRGRKRETGVGRWESGHVPHSHLASRARCGRCSSEADVDAARASSLRESAGNPSGVTPSRPPAHRYPHTVVQETPVKLLQNTRVPRLATAHSLAGAAMVAEESPRCRLETASSGPAGSQISFFAPAA
jgi:hypothetical protein